MTSETKYLLQIFYVTLYAGTHTGTKCESYHTCTLCVCVCVCVCVHVWSDF